MFPEKVLDYHVQLVPKNHKEEDLEGEKKNDDDDGDTAEERQAKINDLLHFVNEIMNQDALAKNNRKTGAGKKNKKKS